MNKDFKTHEENKSLLLTFIVFLSTFGVALFTFYEYFAVRKYYLNRKLLIHILQNNLAEFEYVNKQILDGSIRESKFNYNGNSYRIWHYTKERSLTLDYNIDLQDNYSLDLIGLFVGSIQGSIQTNKILKLLKSKY